MGVYCPIIRFHQKMASQNRGWLFYHSFSPKKWRRKMGVYCSIIRIPTIGHSINAIIIF